MPNSPLFKAPGKHDVWGHPTVNVKFESDLGYLALRQKMLIDMGGLFSTVIVKEALFLHWKQGGEK